MSNSCLGCGVCCRLFAINITKKEFDSGKYKASAQGNKLFILDQKPNGSCIYQKENKCSIHSIRPQVCRHFFCSSKSKKYTDMIKLISCVKLTK